MPWINKFPDLKNDPRYLEPRVNELSELLAENTKNKNGIRGSLIERLQAGTVSKIKLIGDSITYGVGGTNAGDGTNTTEEIILIDTFDNNMTYREAPENVYSWANLLRQYINANFPSVDLFNAGIGGKSAKWGNSRKALWVSDNEDVVFVMLGTNDRWDCLTPVEFETNLKEFLAYVDARCNTMIVMSATPTTNDNLVNNPPYNFGMREVDRVITKVCTEKGYSHISHYRLMLDYLRNTKKVATDFLQNPGSHPIDPGYKVMWQNLQQELGLIDNGDNWFDFREQLQSIKVLTDWASILPSTPITTKDANGKDVFNERCVTAVAIPNGHGSTNGFPDNTGGVLVTYRFSLANDPYSYQEYSVYQTSARYRRYWTTGNTWSSWVRQLGGTEIERPATMTGFTLNAGATVRKVITTTQSMNGLNMINVTPVSFIPDGIMWSWTRSGTNSIYVNFYNANATNVTISDLLWNVNQITP